ncbi:MAG: hypothetical protein J6X55_17040 [Victivallales bacterium]|nr:hypothetical protein [Victivallales bacterium]
MTDVNDANDCSTHEPLHHRWTCFGEGNLRCDLRKVVLWVLLIVMAFATWGIWLLLGDIQEQFNKQNRKDAEGKMTTEIQQGQNLNGQ